MTCDNDCKNCIYGKPYREKRICTKPNTTCDGECHKCMYKKVMFTKYICTADTIKR